MLYATDNSTRALTRLEKAWSGLMLDLAWAGDEEIVIGSNSSEKRRDPAATFTADVCCCWKKNIPRRLVSILVDVDFDFDLEKIVDATAVGADLNISPP